MTTSDFDAADFEQPDEPDASDLAERRWPKYLETINRFVKPNAEARLSFVELQSKFASFYPSAYETRLVKDEDLRALLVKAGIHAVPDSMDEFHAELRPIVYYDMGPQRKAKIEYLEHHFDFDNHAKSPRRTKTPRVAASDRALRVGGRDVARLKTGLLTLDTATRGGILLRKVAVVGGAPGAGKTALLIHLAYAWLSQGFPVGILAADEDADGLLIRLGQQHGLSRDALENGDSVARAKLAAWCKSVPLILVDGDEDEGTIEALSRELRIKAGSGPSALIVDSMQTARSEVPVAKGADLRAKINVTVAALKRAAKVEGHVVIASSELSKAAYRNKASAENVNALAAFKESGDIEYGVSLALVLTSRAGTSELVDAAVVKNRLGPAKPEFMLRLNHDRADVREASAQDAKATDPMYFKKCDIRAEVEKACGTPLTKNAIADRIGGKRTQAFKTINEMIEAHELHEDRHGVRFPLPGDPGYTAPT